MSASIIIRTFSGREKLLRRSLQSIAAQTALSTTEVLVVVDGVTAIDRDIVGVSEFPFAQIVSLARGERGRSAAANLGLGLVQGEYVNFLDDDDWFLPRHVQMLSDMLEQNSTVAAAYSGALEYAVDVDPSNPSMPSITVLPTLKYVPDVKSLDLLRYNPFPIQGVMFRASLLEKGCKFRTELDALEDWLFWQQLLVGEKFVSTPEVTSAFLVPASATRRAARERSHVEALPVLASLQKSVGVPIASLALALRPEHAASAKGRGRKRGAASHFVERLAERKRQLAATRRNHLQNIEYEVLEIGRNMLARRRERRSKLRPVISGPATVVSPPLPARRERLLQLFDQKFREESHSAGTVIFTSCNGGYLDKAVALARSVKRHHPEVEFHVLLADDVDSSALNVEGVVDRIVLASQLEVFQPGWVFSHNVEELCCAVKPFYFSQLISAGHERVIFLDPDTLVASPLQSVFQDLDDAAVLLTPHLSRPAIGIEAVDRFEISALAHGIFNLGFLAIRNSPSSKAVIDYWRERLREYCYGDIAHGLWTDQKWFNHVPVFFESVRVSRNPGLNAAVWNLENRVVTERDGVYEIDGHPVELFHFSGWDKGVPAEWLRRLSLSPAIGSIIEKYQSETSATSEYRQPRWLYGYYDNGEKITQAQRTCYRKNLDLQEVFPNPFVTGPRSYHDWLHTVGINTVEERYDETIWVRRHF